ncbi:hypothetical protein ACLOJK_039258 [Asimina triloba]
MGAVRRSSLGVLTGVGDYPCSGQGSGGRFQPPSLVPYESSPHIPSRKRGDSYLKQCLFGNSPFIIVMVPKFAVCYPKMSEERLITPENFDVIREGYGIPTSIILLAPALCETSQDHYPRHLYLKEHMLRAGVWIPFEIGVAKAL